MLKTRENWEKYLLILACAVCAACLPLFYLISRSGITYYSTPDLYCDQLAARLMWEQKSLFPSGWMFGNQFNIISTPAFAALFYGLTGSMNEGMALATALMTVLITAAFLWAMRPFCTPLQLALGLMTMLCCVISVPAAVEIEGQIFYILGSYYACYLVVLFAVWGDWARLVTGKREKVLSVSFAAALLLSFGAGTQSLRQTAVMIVPMCVYELVRLIVLRRRGPLVRGQLRPTLALAGYAVFNLAGVAFIRSLHIPHNSIYGSLAPEPLRNYPDNLKTGLRALRSVTGLKYAVRDGFKPLLFLFWLLAVALVIFFLAQFFRRAKKDAIGTGPELCAALGFLSLLGLLCVNLAMDIQFRSIYLFIWYPLVAFCAVAALGRLGKKLRPVLASALCVLCVANLCISYVPCAVEPEKSAPTFQEEISDWTVEHGYSLLYGAWWPADTVAPWSDGAVLTGCWHTEVFKILPYINLRDVYTEADNRRAVYLFMKSELEEARAYAESQGAVLTEAASFEDGAYVLCTSSRQLMHW